MSEWISVEDRFPKNEDDVLEKVLFVCQRHNEVCCGYKSPYYENTWCDELQTDCCGDPTDEHDVTHWMPLPPPPKEAS